MSKSVIAKRRCAERLLWLYAVLSLFDTLQAQAGEATLAWDPNIESILGGYRLYYGQASGTYTTSKDVGKVTTYTLTDLQDGEKYYFAVKAYSILGLIGGLIQSGFSNEVSATIPSPPTVPTAGFNANPTSGTAPLTVTFTDTSTGNIATWLWDFDEGPTSNAQNAAKTYTNPGSYTVRLTVTGPAAGSNPDTATKTISVAAPAAAPVANFSATPTIGTEPLAVNFTNSSTGSVTSYSWNFGDCSTNPNNCTSTLTNPPHTYSTAGTYTVSLTATGTGGTNPSTKTLTSYITVSSSSGGGGGNNAGLVGAYNFEEASGTTVVDASGEGNTGTISGATRITQGYSGKALSFDGVNDWVTINDSASLDLTTGMTLEAWVYPTVDMSQWATVVLKEQPDGGLYELYANGDQSQPLTSVTVGGQYRVLSAGPWLLKNQWTHLAATYDGTTQRLYVDGTQVAERPQTGPIEVSNSPLRLGGNSVWGEYFEGRIDEVRVYNRALSADEVYLASTGSGTTPPPPPPPPPPPGGDAIFQDGFESGSFSAWTEVDGEGDLNVTGAAALNGTFGLATLIDNTTRMYVRDNSPTNEARYRARFYFDPNAITMASGDLHNLMVALNAGGAAAVARIEFLRSAGGSYQVRGSVRNDAGAYSNTPFVTISDASHRIEIDWQSATSAGANNGSLRLWIDGTSEATPTQTLSGIDNDTLRIEQVQLGPQGVIDAGTVGTYYFDAFVSRRTTFIGP